MTTVYDFLKYQPETYKQLTCKDLLFAYYDCPQSRNRDDIFTHHSYLTFIYAAVKFRKWADILRWSQTDTLSLKYPSAIRHYARGMAYVGKGQLAEAKAELKRVEA